MRANKQATYSLTKSSCSFLGIMVSRYGSSSGYCSATLERMPRWTDDLTLVFAPTDTL